MLDKALLGQVRSLVGVSRKESHISQQYNHLSDENTFLLEFTHITPILHITVTRETGPEIIGDQNNSEKYSPKFGFIS